MTETRVCAFCGGRPVTREHIWPAWFAEWLHATDDQPLLHGREGEQGVVGAWEAQKIAATVRRFCAICNNGWMSEIEAEAQAIMMPLLVDPDEAAALSPHDQEVLARWAYKTALVGDFSVIIYPLHGGGGCINFIVWRFTSLSGPFHGRPSLALLPPF